jgi:predicted nuclease with RNAse H fold
MKVVGLDLAGKPENDTGFCLLDGSSVDTDILHSDQEIIDRIREIKPDLIAIDAPFDFPEDGMYRDCDLELRKRGYDPLSPQFPGMQVLVKRVKGLLGKLEESGSYEIIEVFSDASKDILPIKPAEGVNEDEFDALACAITGEMYLKDKYGDLDGIIVPEE